MLRGYYLGIIDDKNIIFHVGSWFNLFFEQETSFCQGVDVLLLLLGETFHGEVLLLYMLKRFLHGMGALFKHVKVLFHRL